MGEKFNQFRAEIQKQVADQRKAQAQAFRQFDELKDSLGHFNQESVLEERFDVTDRNHIGLREVLAVTTIREKAFSVQFLRSGDEPYEAPQNVGVWSLTPVIENDQFKWRVADLNRATLTNDELADEVAIYMTKQIKPELE